MTKLPASRLPLSFVQSAAVGQARGSSGRLSVPSRSFAFEELDVFADFLRRHRSARLLCVAGDSSTGLPLLYQQLPTIAMEAASSGENRGASPDLHLQRGSDAEVRVVTHELAGKGMSYCRHHRLYCTIKQEQSRGGHHLHRGKDVGSNVTYGRTWWIVPRLVVHLENLDQFLASWAPPQTQSQSPSDDDDVQVLLLINTDTSEEALLGGVGIASGYHAPAQRFAPPEEHDAPLGGTLLEMLPTYFTPSRKAKTKGTCGGDMAALTIPLLHLKSLTPFLHRRKKRRLLGLSSWDDVDAFIRPSTASSVGNALSYLSFISSPNCAGDKMKDDSLFLTPSVYADRTSLGDGVYTARHQNHIDAAVVESLPHLAPPMTAGAPSRASTTFPEVGAVHRYYPVVTKVGDLLQNRCCLSDIYVVELPTDDAALSLLLEGWPGGAQSMHAPLGNVHVPDEAVGLENSLRSCTAAFAVRRGEEERRGLLHALGHFLNSKTNGRRVFWWSVDECAGASNTPPRVGFCFTYEVFSRQAIAPLIALEEKLVKEQSDSLDGVAACEDPLPTTVAFLAKRVLQAVAERGWRLVHQESHHDWDSTLGAPDDPSIDSTSCVVGGTVGDDADGAATVHDRVVRGAADSNYDKQQLLLQEQSRRSRPWAKDAVPVGEPNASTDSFPAAEPPVRTNGMDCTEGYMNVSSGRTSHQLWAAAVHPIPEERGLALWRGARVALPNGRRGVVVGFAPAPEWVSSTATEAAGKGHDALRARYEPFISWFHSASFRDAGRYRWKAALPHSLQLGNETQVWPVVQFADRDAPTLVLPTVVQKHRIAYPTVCFVSASQQRCVLSAQRRQLLDALEVEEELRGGSDADRLALPCPLDEDEPLAHVSWGIGAAQACAPLREEDSQLPATEESHERSVTTLELPLRLVLAETPASLFSAYLQLQSGASFWHILPPARDGQASSLASRQGIQAMWHRLHTQRRRECLLDGTAGAVAPTPVPLTGIPRQVVARDFGRRLGALRCVIVSTSHYSALR